MPLPMLKENVPVRPVTQIKNIVAIAAGKGGVGKSTLTVNMGRALQKMGYTVGILDADIYGPSLRRMLQEDVMPKQKGEFFTPAASKGIKFMSMSFFRRENEAAAVRAPIANGVIGQFLKNVEWGTLDFLLIDFPPGTGDIQLTLAQQANLNGAVMVTTPQEVALMDVRKAMHLFDQVNVPILGVVENMSYFPHPETKEPLYLFGKGGGMRLSQEGGVPFLGSIPVDPAISGVSDTGESLFECKAETAAPFTAIAKEMVQMLSKVKSLMINKLVQKDLYHVGIQWSDGLETIHRYSDLQKECPCANCHDENTGECLIDFNKIPEDLQAGKIEMVGRYALRFQFSSGCTTGIFPFDRLRQLAGSGV